VKLADHFLKRACADYGISERRLSEQARAALLRYPWPGNVRELANLMERLAVLDPEGEFSACALGLPAAPAPEPAAPRAAARAPLRWERRRVTLLRAGVEFVGEGDEVLDAGRTLETLVEKVAGFGGRLEGLSPSGLLASFGLGLAEDAPTRSGHAAL